MSRFFLVSSLLLAAMCFLVTESARSAPPPKKAEAANAEAKDADEDAPVKIDPKAEEVARLGMAFQLADYGRKTKSPETLIVAARILRKVTPIPSDDKPSSTGGSAGDAKDPGDLIKQSDDLLQEARDMAKGDKTVADLANKVASDKKRGGLDGPKMFRMNLRPHQTDTFNLKFNKGQMARITFRGDGHTDLHVKVLNNAGSIRSTDGGAHPTVSWVPHQKDSVDYQIKIRNNGNVAVFYQMFTN